MSDEYQLYEVNFDGSKQLKCCNYRYQRGWYIATDEMDDEIDHVDLMCGHCVAEMLGGVGFLNDNKWTLVDDDQE